jgi:hypothetical protein
MGFDLGVWWLNVVILQRQQKSQERERKGRGEPKGGRTMRPKLFSAVGFDGSGAA